MSAESIDFEAEGLLEGLEGDRRQERLALLRQLAGEGVPLSELRRTTAAGTVVYLAADRVIGGSERYTAEQLAELSGVELPFLLEVRRAMGLPMPEVGEAAFTREELDGAKRILLARAAGITDEEILELVRMLGRNLAQVAETLRAMPMRLVARPGISEPDLASDYARAVAQLYPLVDPLMGNLLALHLRHAAASELIGALERGESPLPGAREVAVCFADLVGFTRLGEEVPADELGHLALRLEVLAGGIARPPVKLVKTIGDAVMLAAPEPEPLLGAALELLGAADEEGQEFPQLRAGAAMGEAVPRAGDWFGRPVNLASRITGIARPGSLLAEGQLRDAVGDGGLRWSFAGERHLRGIRQPVPLFRARRHEQTAARRAALS
jgi:adenylate cyclase